MNLSKKILSWYDNNKRTLPWRINQKSRKSQYYRILSEFMLQQTQVKTVIPFFNNFVKKKIDYNNSVTTTIRTTKGTNFDYFSEEAKNKFFNEEYQVTNLSDRMGMRLEGPKLENIVNTNIKSEGLVKGVVQVPADGNPIIMFSDHGSIGGYPKIAVVITADHDKAAQLAPGSRIKFKEVNLDEAESLFKTYSKDTKSYLEKIK